MPEARRTDKDKSGGIEKAAHPAEEPLEINPYS
jgi:hypothetical protein